MKTDTRRFVWIWLMLVFLVLASCGRKTAPQVPDSPRPEAVRNIQVATRDTNAYLSWPVPIRNIEGKSLTPGSIRLFRIYRADLGRERKKARYKLYREIDMASPAPASVRNGTVFWTDTDLKYGQVYSYRIRAVSVLGGVSTPSDEIRAAPLLSLSPPTRISAQGGDGIAVITWATTTSWSDGSAYEGFVGYNIYRGTEPGRMDEAPLNKAPLATNTYRDTSVANTTTYYYRVRAVDSLTPPWQESADSAETTATPKDMTPPEQPTGLTIVPGGGRVFVTWNENKERDLAGYHVYRSVRTGGPYERLNAELLARTTFSDDTAIPGRTYMYVVTAVDRSGNESGYSAEKNARLESPGRSDMKGR